MSNNPQVKKILVLAANPKQTVRLRVDEEVRDIKEGLLRSRFRDKFELRYEEAVRPRDIRRAVLNFRPNIIHFSGHGDKTDGLLFEDETGNSQFVTGEALAGLFEQFSQQIECVLMNACYSEVQADAIVQHINYVIGMNAPIHDRDAIEFAVGFYDALAAYNPEYDKNTPFEFAFNIACNSIKLAGVSGNNTREAVRVSGIPGENTIAVLKKKPGLELPKTTIVEPIQRANKQYSGKVKFNICNRLVGNWQDLADYFEISLLERNSFRPGREPHGIWEWLEQRNKLDELEVALSAIERDDLVEELKKN
ncbi:MAG: CHAT domain-containing protein [Heteroscytonema crispum UTEX LB 1556]